MADFFESDNFILPSQVRNDVAGRIKENQEVKSLELRLKGDALENTKEFATMLLGLKKRGVKISHEVSIKLEFPRAISRDRALGLVESLPKPKNGYLKVRVELGSPKRP